MTDFLQLINNPVSGQLSGTAGLGWGNGAELRQPLGIAIVGGLIMSQMLTLFTTGKLGEFYTRTDTTPIEVTGQNVGGSQNLPLVVTELNRPLVDMVPNRPLVVTGQSLLLVDMVPNRLPVVMELPKLKRNLLAVASMVVVQNWKSI